MLQQNVPPCPLGFGAALKELWRACTCSLTMSMEEVVLRGKWPGSRLRTKLLAGAPHLRLPWIWLTRDVEVSAASDHGCIRCVRTTREDYPGNSYPASGDARSGLAIAFVTPTRCLYAQTGQESILLVAVVSVRSKPVLVKPEQLSSWSHRIVSGCVPGICCQLVSRYSHHHTITPTRTCTIWCSFFFRFFFFLHLCDRAHDIYIQAVTVEQASWGKEEAQCGGDGVAHGGCRHGLSPSLSVVDSWGCSAVPASSGSALAPALPRLLVASDHCRASLPLPPRIVPSSQSVDQRPSVITLDGPWKSPCSSLPVSSSSSPLDVLLS